MACKIALMFPLSGRFVSPFWAIGVAGLISPIGSNKMSMYCVGKPRHEVRNNLIRMALEENAEFGLFLDDDTIPPINTILALLNVLENADDTTVVCGGIIATKTSPTMPVVIKDLGLGPFWKWKFGDIFPCDLMGTGCMLIRMSVFQHLPEPWFHEDVIVNPNQSVYVYTDDGYFCTQLKKNKFKILAHGGVLPVHCDQDGNMYTLPNDSYPLKDCPPNTLWYSNMIERQKVKL